MANPWYKTGTVSVTNNSKNVAGVGTLFVINSIAAGDILFAPDGNAYEVDSVQSDTLIVLTKEYAGSTATNQSYGIVRFIAQSPISLANLIVDKTVKWETLIDQHALYLSGDATSTVTAPENICVNYSLGEVKTDISEVDCPTGFTYVVSGANLNAGWFLFNDTVGNYRVAKHPETFKAEIEAVKDTAVAAKDSVVASASLIDEVDIRTFEPSVKPTLKFDFARNEAIVYDGAEHSFVSKSVTQAVTDGDLTVNNGSANIYDARGHLSLVSANKLRLSFNPDTGESEGFLNERAVSNYLLYSEDFTQAEWVKSNATSIEATGNTETVFGNLEIQELFGANDTAKTSRFQSYAVADDNNSYTGSVYIKRGDTDYGVFQINLLGGTTEVSEVIYVDFTNPNIVTSGNGKLVDSDGQGGYRIEFTITNNTTGNTTLRYYVREPSSMPNSIGLNADTLTIYAGGFMLESGLAATSYIKTTDININRVSDTVEINNIAQYLDFNRGFSIYFEMGGESASDTQQVLFNCNLDSTAFTFRLAVSDDNESFNFYLRNNPSRLDFNKPSDGEFHKYLISFDGVNFNAYVDGVKVRSVAYVDPAVTTASFGTFFLGSIAGNTSLTTKLKLLEVTPKGLSEAEGISKTGGAN